jgi:hypothetical protein
MPVIGPGVREMRIHTNLEHRVLYVATFPEAPDSQSGSLD